MSHNCVLCKVLFCKVLFLWSGGGTKTQHSIFGKNVRSPERSFFSKIPLFFVAVGVEPPSESEQNCVAKAGVAAAETERKREKGGGRQA